MIIVGVDPGLTGAIAMLAQDGTLIDVMDMPTINGEVSAHLLWKMEDWHICKDWVAVIENVHSSPAQGVRSVFSFGRSKGIVEGVLGGMRHVRPSPSKWKKDMGLDKDKEKSRAMAIARWPDKAQMFARKKDDGRAEAALLAEWFRRFRGDE